MHAAVQVAVDFARPDPQVYKHIKPQSLSDTVDRLITQHANTQTDKDDDKAMRDARTNLVSNIQQQMDKHINWNLTALQRASANRNIDEQWRCISRCIERGFVDGTDSDAHASRRMKGHGKPKIRATTADYNFDNNDQPDYLDDADAS